MSDRPVLILTRGRHATYPATELTLGDPEVAVRAGLTDREVEVLRRVALAKPNKAIARELMISEETVRNHVRHIYEKIAVQSRAGAALFAMEHDLIHR